MEKQIVDITYCFLHQKLQVYAHSALEWQRDDIEMAVADFVSQMNSDLYKELAGETPDFLQTHSRFETDLKHAVLILNLFQDLSPHPERLQ